VQYARPSGRDLEPVDLAAVVRQSVSICEHLVERGGISLAVEVDPDLPVVHAVSGQLEQVLINLITNACHAMPLGAGLLHVETRVAQGRMLLSVTDTGRGVPEENLSRVFEPFFTTKGEGQGTGLGLSIVRNIVEQHRGEIQVVSEVGRGTTFEVALPCRTIEAPLTS